MATKKEINSFLKENNYTIAPYNHFKSRSYDGKFIRRYVTHMISIPKNKTDEFIDFLSKRENVGEIVMKIDREVLKQ